MTEAKSAKDCRRGEMATRSGVVCTFSSIQNARQLLALWGQQGESRAFTPKSSPPLAPLVSRIQYSRKKNAASEQFEAKQIEP
jgi:hypothetical protein